MRAALEKAGIACRYQVVPGLHDMRTALDMWPAVVTFHAKAFDEK